MDGLKRLLRDEPTIIAAAIRQTLLAVVLLGLELDEAQVAGIMVAVEAILTMANRALVTPVARVEATVERQVQREVRRRSDRLLASLTEEEAASLAELRAERDQLAAELAAKEAP